MVSTTVRRAAAKKLRANTTPHERILWRALKELPTEGTHFRRQAPIGPYVVDFFCPAKRLIVELDGGVHAFILDTVVAGPLRRHGVGTRLVEIAARQETAAGCQWLHVDFEDHLGTFYFGSCGFRPANVGLIRLGEDPSPIR